LPGTEGKLEVVQNLIGGPLIERAHEGQHLRHHLQPGGVAVPLITAPRLRPPAVGEPQAALPVVSFTSELCETC